MEGNDKVHTTYNLKLIILGDSAIGKTSIIERFLNEKFDNNTSATIVPTFVTKVIKINDIIYNINIWDLPGQDRNPILTKPFVKDSEGIVYCCEVYNTKSMENLKYWEVSLKSLKNIEEIPKILIRNKSDLLKNEDDYNNNINSMNEYSKQLGCLNSFLTSAKTGSCVNDALYFLINEMIKNVKEEDIQSYNQIKIKKGVVKNKNECC